MKKEKKIDLFLTSLVSLLVSGLEDELVFLFLLFLFSVTTHQDYICTWEVLFFQFTILDFIQITTEFRIP